MKLSVWWPTYGNSIRMGGATSRMGGATSLSPTLPYLRVSKVCLMRPGSEINRYVGHYVKTNCVPRPIRSHEIIEAVRASMLRSPRRSARKHASALGLSDRSARRILHEDFHFYPYKMAIAQELYKRDFNSRRNACEVLLEVVPEDAIIVFSDEAHIRQQTKHTLHQYSTIAWKAFAFTQSHSVVRNFLR